MITLRKKHVYGTGEKLGKVIDVVLDKKDYGVSFADIIGECNIEGHDVSVYDHGIKSNEYREKCKVCGKVRDVTVNNKGGRHLGQDLLPHWYDDNKEYGDWYPHECYECEENCIMSRPLHNFKCPNCHRAHGVDIYDIDGLVHSGADETLLFDCGFCHEKDQIIA